MHIWMIDRTMESWLQFPQRDVQDKKPKLLKEIAIKTTETFNTSTQTTNHTLLP